MVLATYGGVWWASCHLHLCSIASASTLVWQPLLLPSSVTAFLTIHYHYHYHFPKCILKYKTRMFPCVTFCICNVKWNGLMHLIHQDTMLWYKGWSVWCGTGSTFICVAALAMAALWCFLATLNFRHTVWHDLACTMMYAKLHFTRRTTHTTLMNSMPRLLPADQHMTCMGGGGKRKHRIPRGWAKRNRLLRNDRNVYGK